MQASKPGQALLRLGLLALAALSIVPVAPAQQSPTASKSAEISVFGGFTNINSDYGTRNNGVTFGADYTRFFRFPVVPSFEIRANRTSGLSLAEESVLFGLRLEAPFRQRFHPYVTLFYGGTKIYFKMPPSPTYTYDQTSATSLGGGIDVDVVHNFRAKFDYTQQFENFGPNGTQPNNANFTLTPAGFTIGVVYRIPFKPRQGFK